MAASDGNPPQGDNPGEAAGESSGTVAVPAGEPHAPIPAAAEAAPGATITLSGVAVKTTLDNLSTILKTFVLVDQPPVPLPPQILGTLQQPAGTPGSQLQIEVFPPSPATSTAGPFGADTAGSQVLAVGLSDSDGNFSIALPGGVVLPAGQSLAMRVRGSAPGTIVPVTISPDLLGPLGYVGTNTLAQSLSPIPAAIYDQLAREIAPNNGQSANGSGATAPILANVTLGESGSCIRVLENQLSFEEFPYGIFFQFMAPTVFQESYNSDGTRVDTVFNRAQLTGPISVDEFRQGLLTAPVLAGSLGLGYVLRCSQQWNFSGLALGDLVYSLPLAPGEQQQVVVEEQVTSLQVQESETVFGAVSSQASAVTDSTTQATFQSAFQQAAQGGSNYNTASETGAMTVGGGLLGILGGPSGSLGETVSSGSTSNWMNGLQDYASSASEGVQTYAEQQASAQRSAQRTAMRMATASESTTVTTKTITNHNKLHALTLQYFEVVRQFDVTTVYDSVSLVCLVPMDTVWFLPPGQKQFLDDVITDSDLSNAIQYSSQLNSSLANMAAQVSMAIPMAQLFPGFVSGTLNNVNAQLSAAADEATSLAALLGGLGANYATQATESSQLQTQVQQAETAISQYLSSPTNVSPLEQAVPMLNNGASLAQALFQQLSAPSVSGGMTRQQVLARYAGLLAHSDVLARWLPAQYATGLSRLERFASDPRASVALDSLAEDVIQFSANASVLPFDHIYVSAVTRWGTRIGPVDMMPNPPVSVPGQFDSSKAFKTAEDLLQYLQGQRNPGNSTAPSLQASIALPRNLSPSDVVGFEITHTMDSFTYQLATPLDMFTSFFGTNGSAWPGGILGEITGLLAPPVAPVAQTYTAAQLAQELGPPFLWNFSASLTASVMGNPEPYVKPSAGVVELPPGAYPIPAMEVSPILKYSDLILIESTLQHVLRNMTRYSKAVWSWLTPEERVMILEPYLVSFPGMPANTVPLLDCIGNEVLGFYGNCMMVPFSIPQSLGEQQNWPATTGQLEDDLLQFHRQGAPHQTTSVMLPTHGVLGEAMLGQCASGEKIDLTRFWNWQDSPADTAPTISPVAVPGSQLPALAAVQGPNQLAGMLPTLVNNVNAPTVTPSDALAAALAQKAPTAQLPDMTGSAQLAQLLQSTQTTANQARSDQLAQQTTLTKDAIDQASAVLQAYLTGKSPSSGKGSSSSSGKGSSSGSGRGSSSGSGRGSSSGSGRGSSSSSGKS